MSRARLRSALVLLCGLLTSATTTPSSLAQGQRQGQRQRPAGTPVQQPTSLRCDAPTAASDLPDLPEASGLALARQGRPRLFAVNDSGTAELVVLSTAGRETATVAVTGARVRDWEDLTSAPCGSGSCLYIGDIGDNGRRRDRITVYRMPEPRDGERSVAAEAFDGEYPDGAHDAEAMFAGPGGQLFILTKQARGARLYAFPTRLAQGVNRLTFVGELRLRGDGRRFARITDAETSPDGRRVAVRTNDTLFVVPMASLAAGGTDGVAEASLRSLREPQGEAVAVAADGQLFLAGEGGGRGRPGTFASVACPQAR